MRFNLIIHPNTGPERTAELAKLAELKEKGVITEDELRAQKAKLLSG